LLPTVCRGTEEVLRIVPNDLREASTALAAPQWRTVWSVVLPTARSGLVTAVLLAIAVALGETAPLLLTIFGSAALNVNPFNGPQMAMPLLVFQEVHKPLQSDIDLAYAAALVLFLMVFTLFVVARILSSDWLGNRVRASMNKRRHTKSMSSKGGS
jgi:phosphate transport system permease protein